MQNIPIASPIKLQTVLPVPAGRGANNRKRNSMKVAIIGAGSTYTPELIEGIIQNRAQLGLDEVAMMDIDAEKLRIVGGLAVRKMCIRDSLSGRRPANLPQDHRCGIDRRTPHGICFSDARRIPLVPPCGE